MVEHVKLEIAVQKMAENIAELYQKIENCKNKNEIKYLELQLEEALKDKDLVAKGDKKTINRILG